MDIFPSIDLRAAQVVRLAQGDYARQTTYAADPGETARQFAALGCRWIHVVDLDAARSGELTNLPVVERIVRESGLRVEMGGGIRDDQAVRRVLEAGVERLSIGSAALRNWDWFESLAHRSDLAGRISLDLPARNGRLAAHGWTEQSELSAVDCARRVRGWPLASIVYTDILCDGMLQGPNFAATAEVIAATDVGVIASGGVGSVADVQHCRQIGCAGVIIGRAYYEGRIDLAAALHAAGQ